MTDSTDSETQPKSSRSQRDLSARTETGLALLAAATATQTVDEYPYLAIGESTPKLLRPAIGVGLLNEERSIITSARALLDTGADETTLPDQWAELLGIDIYTDPECMPREALVADGRPSLRYCYTGGLNIMVAGESMFLDVVMFCEKLPVVLLGRKHFFDRYLVLLDQRDHRFFLERLPDPEEDDDPDGDVELDREFALD